MAGLETVDESGPLPRSGHASHAVSPDEAGGPSNPSTRSPLESPVSSSRITIPRPSLGGRRSSSDDALIYRRHLQMDTIPETQTPRRLSELTGLKPRPTRAQSHFVEIMEDEGDFAEWRKEEGLRIIREGERREIEAKWGVPDTTVENAGIWRRPYDDSVSSYIRADTLFTTQNRSPLPRIKDFAFSSPPSSSKTPSTKSASVSGSTTSSACPPTSRFTRSSISDSTSGFGSDYGTNSGSGTGSGFDSTQLSGSFASSNTYTSPDASDTRSTYNLSEATAAALVRRHALPRHQTPFHLSKADQLAGLTSVPSNRHIFHPNLNSASNHVSSSNGTQGRLAGEEHAAFEIPTRKASFTEQRSMGTEDGNLETYPPDDG